MPTFYAETIIPGEGFAGSHIYVTNGTIAFDFHGYSSRLNLLIHHTNGWSRCYPEGWHCSLAIVDFDLLSTVELNDRKMLGPDQYWGDPISRARDFIDSTDHSAGPAKAMLTCP